jgi:glycosyltransferase involved in cell wall biosynthesis
MNQTYQNIECILVDDATPDNSMEIVAEIRNNHPLQEAVKIIRHSENKGLSVARNTGVKASSGEYIFFLDSDDELPPNCIEILVSSMDKREVDFVIGEIQVIGNKRKAYPPLLLKEGIYQGNDFVLESFLKRKWYEMAWNKLVKRSLFTEKEVWFEEGIVHEDTLWSFQLALAAQSMAVTHTPTYCYHIQNNSITQKKSTKNMDSFYIVLEQIIISAKQRNLFEVQKIIFSYLENLQVFFIKQLLRGNFEKQYIQEQRNKINQLYKKSVWTGNKRKIEFLLKDFVLFLWNYFKHL